MCFHAAIRARKGYKIMIQAVKKMKISDVRIRLVENGDGKLRAVASMTIDDCFVIHDIKIIDGPEGIFVAMPSKKNGRGEYKQKRHTDLLLHSQNINIFNRFLISQKARENSSRAFYIIHEYQECSKSF